MYLVHLDLSDNGLDVTCVEYLCDQLLHNHVLLSLLIFGNADGRVWVDTRGFVMILPEDEDIRLSGTRSRIMEVSDE